jgi:hypothetical protein
MWGSLEHGRKVGAAIDIVGRRRVGGRFGFRRAALGRLIVRKGFFRGRCFAR